MSSNLPPARNKSNHFLAIAFFVSFLMLALVVGVLTWQLIKENDEWRTLANTRATANDELSSELTRVNLDRNDLANKLAQLRSQTQAFVDGEIAASCQNRLVNLGVARYEIPCNYQAFFDLKYTTQAESVGYINDKPISVLASEPVGGNLAKVTLYRFSTALNNYQADPLTTLVTNHQQNLQQITTLSTNTNTVVYQVSKIYTSFGEYYRIYAQKKYNGDVYLIYFDYLAKDAEKLKSIINTFQWSI